jgi:anti-sigma factor RsiW
MGRCDELVQYLAAYADGELGEVLKEHVCRHLQECERCRTECSELARVVELYRESACPEVPVADWARVEAELERCLKGSPAGYEPPSAAPGRGRRVIGWRIFAATALAAAVLLVAFLMTPAAPGRAPADSVDVLAVSPQYDYYVLLPAYDGDFLAIDVVNVE